MENALAAAASAVHPILQRWLKIHMTCSIGQHTRNQRREDSLTRHSGHSTHNTQ
jgi:hypothetical protein